MKECSGTRRSGGEAGDQPVKQELDAFTEKLEEFAPPNLPLGWADGVASKTWACPGFSDSGLGPIPVGYLFRLDSKLIGLR